jgi:predicted MPP superfamily phosphohydrolase
MHLLTIGDLHGSPAWKRINPEKYDRVIFMGDYVDSEDQDDETVYANLKAVIKRKEMFAGKVTLLWGNHDLAYFYGGHERHYCSGFRPGMLSRLFAFYTHYRALFQAAYQAGNNLWTHAGVTQKYYNNCIEPEILPEDENLAATLNRLFDQYYEPLYYAGTARGGLHEHGGIFWADARETVEDPLIGYHQVVGHTKTRKGIVRADHYGNDTSVTFVDCLASSPEFLKLEI